MSDVLIYSCGAQTLCDTTRGMLVDPQGQAQAEAIRRKAAELEGGGASPGRKKGGKKDGKGGKKRKPARKDL
jgi:hypothetical protein